MPALFRTAYNIGHWLVGSDFCPECGSGNVVRRGYCGIDRRIHCRDCGKETRIDSRI